MSNQTNQIVNPLAPAMMATYASLMKQFLDVQRDVMIAALQSGDFDEAQLMSMATLNAPTVTSAPAPVLTAAAPVASQPVAVNGHANGHAVEAAVPAPVMATPKPVAVPAPVVAKATPTGDVSEEAITDALLDIMAERTGYPPEMIELDLDLEADLGVDSIKKVEILGSFQEQLGDLVDPALMDDMTQQKSLGDIIAFIMANKA